LSGEEKLLNFSGVLGPDLFDDVFDVFSPAALLGLLRI
jgi:hypothetical protein